MKKIGILDTGYGSYEYGLQMKIFKLPLLLVLLLSFNFQLSAQEANAWTASSSSISLYAGTLAFVTPLGVTYDHLWHRLKGHIGLSTGMTFTFYDGFDSAVLGGYLAMVLMTGMQEHHFEGRLGCSYHPINVYPEGWSANEVIRFMPVIALGYRFQKPDGNRYYRVSVGTGGIGFGIGFVLHQKDNKDPV